ncbi:MAG TPA: potassium transporter Kup [Anaeromyxobacteraceae bacterium]|nr:potassium transporter Kup [Anaeromyxobacteraceae bacterium]
MAALALGAIGVVYGDIGTSPLYALKESFHGSHGVQLTPDNVLGILSLVVWAMTFVVAFKYLSFVMRADNRGEGGILALMALVGQQETTRRGRRILLVLGLFGAALLYGDGVITPAISVLGAMEGLTVATPAMKPAVVPATVVILVLLFAFQKRGTATVGAVFGPVMLLWFVSIAAIGAWNVWQEPGVLRAVNPVHAIRFFSRNGAAGFLVLGSVVLVLTGAEALYADMGHFGRRPIRLAWYGVAMPALVLNYMGQGAFLLRHPGDVANPFYESVPPWALWPMVGIATAAAIVASQALISGAYSLTNQAIQLGYAPRLTVRHTSRTEYGQIYIPEVNWMLATGTVALVFGFGSSDALAAAYGIAVTGTMTITTLLFHRVARDRWRWTRWAVWPLTGSFLVVDVAFLLANLVKIRDGGWFPLVAGLAIFTILSTWKLGRDALARNVANTTLPLDLFLPDLERHPPHRIPGTAVFMTSDPNGTPGVLLHHLKHNKVLHKRVLIVSVVTEEIPSVDPGARAIVRDLGNGIHAVTARYGFMETPNVPQMLAGLPPGAIPGPRLEKSEMETTYYLGRETLLASGPARMPRWRKRLFIVLARNALSASAFFGLPPNRVVEMGAQVQF